MQWINKQKGHKIIWKITWKAILVNGTHMQASLVTIIYIISKQFCFLKSKNGFQWHVGSINKDGVCVLPGLYPERKKNSWKLMLANKDTELNLSRATSQTSAELFFRKSNI